MVKTGKVYFPNLNAIRFIAAFMVVFHHIEQFKLLYKMPNNFDYAGPIYLMGKLGVVLFFVLSGFLITYLLLKEESRTGSIRIRNFYVRRMLRIWPLYFLVFIVALFVLPHIPFLLIDGYDASEVQSNLWLRTLLFLLFLPNLMMIASPTGNGFIPGANQLWSIGTEEQFYLFWPLIFKATRANRFVAMLAIIVGYLVLCYVVAHLTPSTGQKNLFTFLGLFNIDCMAIGGIAALIYFHQHTAILNIIYNRYLQWGILLLTLLSIAGGFYFSRRYFPEIYAVLFSIIILNFATNPRPVFNLESRWTNYLGKISYGIYMYHCIAIMIVITSLRHFDISGNLQIYTGTVLLTVALAAVSYRYFEERFIRLKLKFSAIISGDNAKEPDDRSQDTSAAIQLR
jgi:peptidoglycan/LPS O-acetylase OafA/YrhL